MKRDRLVTLALTLACGVGTVAVAGSEAFAQRPGPPNILVIYVDDLGYGDLGSYEHLQVRTPNLDRLALEGLRLTSYYAPAPLCSPSRAGLLTGRTNYRTGIEDWIPQGQDVQLGRQEITIAELLKQRGYQTAIVGKWHLNGGLGLAGHAQPGDQGFDHWFALHAFPIPHNRNPRNFYRDGEALGQVEGYTGPIVIDEAIGWLERRDPEAPFFLYVATIEPHSTIANPPEYNAMYSQYTRGVPDPFENGLAGPPTNLEARGPGEYWANVTYMDHQLGRLLDRIDALGLRDETLVFFASDNGAVTTDWRHWWEVNIYGDTSGLRGRKGDLYEGGIRVPAIVRWPGHVPAGGVSDEPVIGYDLLPTLASVVGFDPPSDRPIDGEDFSPLFDGGTVARRQPLYWEFNDDQGFHFALRDGNWKLLADEALERVELYDLGTDRFEVFDLSAVRPKVTASLLAKLRAIDQSVENDPFRPVR